MKPTITNFVAFLAVLWLLPATASAQETEESKTKPMDAAAAATDTEAGQADPAAPESAEAADPADTATDATEETEEVEEVEEVEEIEEIEVIEDLDVAETGAGRYGQNYANPDRISNTYLARTSRAGKFVVSINHRAFAPMSDDPWHDFLGLDGGGLKIGIGLRYGILDDLDVGILRLNGTSEVFDTYELDARYRILAQEQFLVDLALRAGVSWFVQQDQEDASGFFGQLLADRIIADRVIVAAGLLVHSDSSADRKTEVDEDYSFAASLGVEYRFLDWLAADFEIAQTLAGYSLDNPNFAAGLKIYTYQHTFSLLLSNTQYIGADGVVANTWRGDPSDWIIGFTITREI